MLLAPPRVADTFKEAQRPIAAALRIQDHDRRYAVIRSEVARFAVQRIRPDGTAARSISSKKNGGLSLSKGEVDAKMVAMLTCCRTAGDWKASFALTESIKENFKISLREPWLQLCIGSIPAAQGLIRLQETGSMAAVSAYLDSLPPQEREDLRAGFIAFSRLFGGLPANLLFTQSLPLFDESLRISSSSSAPSDTSAPSLGEGNAGDKALALSSSTNADSLLAAQNGKLLHRHTTVVNPSFLTYLRSQGIAKSEQEVASLVAALTGGTSSYVSGVVNGGESRDVANATTKGSSLVRRYQREITFRLNTHCPEWKAVRELLRHMQPYILPMPWYPDEVLWRVTLTDGDALSNTLHGAADKSNGRHNNTSISNDRDKLKAATAISYVRHTLKALADARLINYQSVASLLPALLLYPNIVRHITSISRGETSHHRAGSVTSLKLLDLCAAPGGKTGQLLDLVKDVAERTVANAAEKGHAITLSQIMSKVLLIANDADERRLRQLRGRLQNISAVAGFTHFSADEFPISVSNNNSDDGGDHNTTEAGRDEGFDCVMVDVPCSGEGRLQRDSKGWTSWHPQQGLQFHEVQLRSLRRAVAAAKVGGVVVYSTCTLNPLENEAVVAAAVEEGLVDLVPILHTNRHREGIVPQASSIPTALRNGRIPPELEPFLEAGLGTWKLPLPNGSYVDPSTLAGDSGGRGGRSSPHYMRGIPTTAYPPASAAIRSLLSDCCVRIVPHREWGSSSSSLTKEERVMQGGVDAAYAGMTTEAFFLCKMVVKRHPVASDKPPSVGSSHMAHATETRESAGKGKDNQHVFSFANAKSYLPVVLNATEDGSRRGKRGSPLSTEFVEDFAEHMFGAGPSIASEVFFQGVAALTLQCRSDKETAAVDVFWTSEPLNTFLRGSFSTARDSSSPRGSSTLVVEGNPQHAYHHHEGLIGGPKHINESLQRQLLSFGQHLFSIRPSSRQLRPSELIPPCLEDVCLTQAGAEYVYHMDRNSQQILSVPVEVVHHLVAAAGRRNPHVVDVPLTPQPSSPIGAFVLVQGNARCSLGWLNAADPSLQLVVKPNREPAGDRHEDEETQSNGPIVGLRVSLPPASIVVSADSFTDPFWHLKNFGRSGRRGSTISEREAEKGRVAEAHKRQHPVHARWVGDILPKDEGKAAPEGKRTTLQAGPIILRSRLVPAHVGGSEVGAELVLPAYLTLVQVGGSIGGRTTVAAVMTLTATEEELLALKTLLPRYASSTSYGATLMLPPPGSENDEEGLSQVRGLLSGAPAALPSMFKIDGNGRGRDSFNYTPSTHSLEENTFALRSSSPITAAALTEARLSLPYQKRVEQLGSRSAQAEVETLTLTGDLLRQGNVGGLGKGNAGEFLEEGGRGVVGFGGSMITTAGFEGEGAAIEATASASTASGPNSGSGEDPEPTWMHAKVAVEAPKSGVVPHLEGSADPIDALDLRYDPRAKLYVGHRLLDALQAIEIQGGPKDRPLLPEAEISQEHRAWAKLGSLSRASRQHQHRHQGATPTSTSVEPPKSSVVNIRSASQLVFGADDDE